MTYWLVIGCVASLCFCSGYVIGVLVERARAKDFEDFNETD